MIRHGSIARPAKPKAILGVIDGKNVWSNSCTSPPVLLALAGILKIIDAALSATLYNVQKFGAQYAWHNPLLNGNNLPKSYRKKNFIERI